MDFNLFKKDNSTHTAQVEAPVGKNVQKDIDNRGGVAFQGVDNSTILFDEPMSPISYAESIELGRRMAEIANCKGF